MCCVACSGCRRACCGQSTGQALGRRLLELGNALSGGVSDRAEPTANNPYGTLAEFLRAGVPKGGTGAGAGQLAEQCASGRIDNSRNGLTGTPLFLLGRGAGADSRFNALTIYQGNAVSNLDEHEANYPKCFHTACRERR
jgi:hypothetical protein